MENENPIYVVSCTETDRDGTLNGLEATLEVVGLFSTLKTATAEINRQLIIKKDKITEYYEKLLKDLQQEISDTIEDLATEKDPDRQELLRYTVEQLEEYQRTYETNKIPETFIGHGPDGELNEVTAKDDSIGWICAFDIQKMTIR